jgi:hypothetical protein
MAELCTKMSGPPPSGEANPYPLPWQVQVLSLGDLQPVGGSQTADLQVKRVI